MVLTKASIPRYLLGAFFVFAGAMHFINPSFYKPMMPDYLPAHDALIALSGVTEIIAGLLLFFPKTMRWGAWFIFAHLLVFLLVHFWMIQRAHDRFAQFPLAVLWGRVFLQFALMGWAWRYTRPEKNDSAG